MKKIIQTLVVSAALAVSAPSWAAAKDKIAVFDVQEAILSTNMAKDQMKAFEGRADIAKMIADAEKLKKDIISLRQEADKAGAKMTQEKAQDQKKAVEFKQADFELIVRKLNSERQAAGKKLMEEISPKLESVVKELVESEGIGLLLDRKASIHAEPAFDITNKVTEKLNAVVGKK